jgi:hypothetical protein
MVVKTAKTIVTLPKTLEAASAVWVAVVVAPFANRRAATLQVVS